MIYLAFYILQEVFYILSMLKFLGVESVAKLFNKLDIFYTLNNRIQIVCYGFLNLNNFYIICVCASCLLNNTFFTGWLFYRCSLILF